MCFLTYFKSVGLPCKCHVIKFQDLSIKSSGHVYILPTPHICRNIKSKNTVCCIVILPYPCWAINELIKNYSSIRCPFAAYSRHLVFYPSRDIMRRFAKKYVSCHFFLDLNNFVTEAIL